MVILLESVHILGRDPNFWRAAVNQYHSLCTSSPPRTLARNGGVNGPLSAYYVQYWICWSPWWARPSTTITWTHTEPGSSLLPKRCFCTLRSSTIMRNCENISLSLQSVICPACSLPSNITSLLCIFLSLRRLFSGLCRFPIRVSDALAFPFSIFHICLSVDLSCPPPSPLAPLSGWTWIGVGAFPFYSPFLVLHTLRLPMLP